MNKDNSFIVTSKDARGQMGLEIGKLCEWDLMICNSSKKIKLTTFCANFSKDVLRSIENSDLHEWGGMGQREIGSINKKKAKKTEQKKTG